jgi:tetratricopeptide (TPR) repeat protein
VFYDSLRPEDSSVTVLIETASIDTNNERRDDDLKANFFDVERFPRITFQSTKLERAGEGYRLHGVLGIRDSLRAVDFPVELLGGHVDDVSSERRVGFEGRLRIDRTHFGVVAPDHPAEVRLVIGHEIEIELQVEARVPGYGGTTYASEDGRSIGEELEAVLEASGPAAARERYAEIMAASAGFDVATRELALLGFRRLEAGDTAGGVLAFELYAEAQPSATADEWLGNAYLAAGEGREAARAYEKALAADPWRPSAIEGLRRLRETTDRAGHRDWQRVRQEPGHPDQVPSHHGLRADQSGRSWRV